MQSVARGPWTGARRGTACGKRGHVQPRASRSFSPTLHASPKPTPQPRPRPVALPSVPRGPAAGRRGETKRTPEWARRAGARSQRAWQRALTPPPPTPPPALPQNKPQHTHATQILPPDEQSCDPYVDTCRTPLYVHESACPSCGGCGYARAQGRGRGGHGRGGAGRHAFRGALHACLACHGLGYARYATVEPPPEATYLTLARPAEADPRSVSAARLRQALRGMGAGAGAGGGAGAAAGAAGAAGAAAASASAAASQQQQQQRQREREAARGSLDRTAFWRSVQDRWQQGTAAEGSAAAAAAAAASAPPRPTSSPAPSKR